jgi:hypothetical protein
VRTTVFITSKHKAKDTELRQRHPRILRLGRFKRSSLLATWGRAYPSQTASAAASMAVEQKRDKLQNSDISADQR